MAKRGQLAGFSAQSLIKPSELLIRKCDVLVPAAIDQVIKGNNAAKLKCRILAEGAKAAGISCSSHSREPAISFQLGDPVGIF
nr:hypothetical protein [Bradyrhizobium hereditatis]